MKKNFKKIVIEVLVLLLVVNVYISFAEKMLTVNWQAETVSDSAGFKIFNNGTELIADIPDPAVRSFSGKIVVMSGGISTSILTEGENIITVRQYDKLGNVSVDSLPATALIFDTIAPPVPTQVMATIEDI
jgi:hypothetical protein